MADAGLINLYYYDESGFDTLPSIPYAWQPVGTTLELSSFPSKRLNVMGFMSRDQKAFFHFTEDRVDTAQVIEAFDRFSKDYASGYAIHQKLCVVNIDNAPWHTSRAFHERQGEWASRGVIVHFLPSYSPELNLIEILWRKIKYEWFPISGYTTYHNMKQAVLDILDGFGTKYQIVFV